MATTDWFYLEAGRREGPGGLATAYFLLSALWRLPGPGFLVCFLAIVPVLSVQRTLDSLIVAETPAVDRNARFSAANWEGW